MATGLAVAVFSGFQPPGLLLVWAHVYLFPLLLCILSWGELGTRVIVPRVSC